MVEQRLELPAWVPQWTPHGSLPLMELARACGCAAPSLTALRRRQ